MGKLKHEATSPEGAQQERPLIRNRRKLLLALILLLVVATHTALFIAGGSWRTLAFILSAVDAVSTMMIIGAVRESRKLEKDTGK